MLNPRIGIITALNMECWAMKALLESPKEVHVPGSGAGHLYYLGDIPDRDGGKHSVVLCFSGVGNNSAAIRATLLLSHFQSVASIIMVGIAGGVPNPTKVEEHVRLGDIVVSDKGGVVKYDSGKEIATTILGKTTVEFIEKYPPRAPSSVLLDSGICEVVTRVCLHRNGCGRMTGLVLASLHAHKRLKGTTIRISTTC
jgi:hypothetical protein